MRSILAISGTSSVVAAAAGGLILIGCGASKEDHNSNTSVDCDPAVETCLSTGGQGIGSGGATSNTGGTTAEASGGSGGDGADSSAAGGAVTGTGGVTDPGSGGSGADGTGGSLASGGAGTGGTGNEPIADPVCDVDDPDEYVLNQKPGGGGSNPTVSGHFAIYGASGVENALNYMEAAHQCFVEDWCWRSTGLSRFSDDGPYNKMNIYSKVIDAGGVMQYDPGEGLAYLEVHPNSVNSQHVVVHEFGHALTLTADGWVDQTNTGLWWESIAQFVAESFANSPYCADARNAHGIQESSSVITISAVIGNSHLTMCNNSNQYEAWPFFTYITNNPDNYAGLGKMVVPELFRTHLGNNETPLHVLERIAMPVSVQTILGRYWARMAYLDIESPSAQDKFFQQRGSVNFDILDAKGGDNYQVKSSRRPRYAGANIIPLDPAVNGTVNVSITNLGNGLDDSNFTATLSIYKDDGTTRYVDLPDGSGQATIANDEEVSLVVANTPDHLYMYNPSDFGAAETSDPANTGLNYSVTITGATP